MSNIICMSVREMDVYLLCLCDTHSADVDSKSGFVVASYLLIPLMVLLQSPGSPLTLFPGDAHPRHPSVLPSQIITH
jgi:hypothetical protein